MTWHVSPPHPQQKNAPPPPQKKKKKNAPPHPQQKKKTRPPPSPPLPPHPPGHLFCNFLPNPAPNAPPSFTLCKRFQSTESFPRPSCEHCVCKRWREGCTPPDPPSLKPCQLASQHMNPVQAYHASIGFANGGPPLLKPCQLASNQMNRFRTHHESIPPPLERHTCFNHTNPFQTNDVRIVFSNAAVCAAPNPPEKKGNICLLSYENSDLRVEVEFSV